MILKKLLRTILPILFLTLISTVTFAQDLEPRLLSAIPTGGNFLVASYSHSSGNILIDNTLPIEDLNANLNNLVVAYARSFKLFNRLAKFDAVIPYSFATFSGVVSNIDSTTSRAGFGDPLFRLSVVLIGSKPYSVADYAQHIPRKFNLGVSFRLRPPFGQYMTDKLLNLGANRWAFKTAIAGSYTFNKRFIIEGHLIGWFFTSNNEFFNGNTLSQKPVLAAQVHFSYIFKPGLWAAVSVGRSFLGTTSLNGTERDDEQNNARFGFVFAYRIKKQHALKFAFTSGVSTRYGADFNTLLVAYQFMWFDKP
jgi:outer membrane putative beta-barrel porin/alpha-amylase